MQAASSQPTQPSTAPRGMQAARSQPQKSHAENASVDSHDSAMVSGSRDRRRESGGVRVRSATAGGGCNVGGRRKARDYTCDYNTNGTEVLQSPIAPRYRGGVRVRSATAGGGCNVGGRRKARDFTCVTTL